jgi:hypothetical protein
MPKTPRYQEGGEVTGAVDRLDPNYSEAIEDRRLPPKNAQSRPRLPIPIEESQAGDFLRTQQLLRDASPNRMASRKTYYPSDSSGLTADLGGNDIARGPSEYKFPYRTDYEYQRQIPYLPYRTGGPVQNIKPQHKSTRDYPKR